MENKYNMTLEQNIFLAKRNLDEIQCILNLRDAWNFVINNIENKFDLEFICKVNEYVSRNESLEWGKLRNRKS